uniref:tRNA (cytosine(34)-C(5))-methyltransferase n=1 Tax=Phallusia mammillata TaxID=59560 RepID=A0A6F9DM01_9ASCI|nr:tRNA (cytosine(34)-C(5))-methyltransferase [Phallusia mammillata]
MGRHRKKFQKKGERAERGHYKDIVRENENYKNYYKEQACFDVAELDLFIESMQQPLPAVFRITGYKKHAKQLLKNMKNTHFEEMTALTIQDELVKTPVALPWYPAQLAWQTDLNRTQIRKNPQLQKFHAFLIAETESGHISRQEAVSMIPPLLLDVKPHHKVLDMCAAPGSKTAQIVELLHQDDSTPIPGGICVANDKDNKRCYMLVHQINRLNSPSSIIVNHDAATFPDIYLKNSDGKERALQYDRVLCDVPCSGDGTLRKNTDVWVKWNIANSIYLHGIQLKILIRGLELLTNGGQLVYSTCSLNPIEDEAVVAAAMHKCGAAVELLKVELPGLKWSPGTTSWRVMDKMQNWYEKYEDLPDTVKNIVKTMFPPEDKDEVRNMHLERCLRLLPHQQDTGGFFVAVLRKVSNLPWQKVISEEELNGSPKQPPKKKRKWVPGFKEDPFVFFGDEEQGIIDEVKSFYGLSDNFPHQQLMCRTKTGKKRHIYFVSELVRNIVVNNEESLKVINTGVRVLSRADNTQAGVKCAFRLVHDGSESMEQFMSERLVKITIEDAIALLSEEQPKFEQLTEVLQKKLLNLDPGSLMFKYVPPNPEADVECDLLMCGWKGGRSARLYMCRNERMHFLHMVGQPVPEYLLPNKSSRRSRAEANAQGNNGVGKEETEEKSEMSNASEDVVNNPDVVEEKVVLENDATV